jgi:hypothetical protein
MPETDSDNSNYDDDDEPNCVDNIIGVINTKNLNEPLKKLFISDIDTDVSTSSFSSSENSVNCNTKMEHKDFAPHQQSEWTPPNMHGLRNSYPILQRFYIDKMRNGNPIDYFEILKDDIRNNRPLTNSQLEYVKKLHPEEMFQVVEIMNEVIKILIQIADLPG